MWLLLELFGVVRGRAWEYIESTSGGLCFAEAGADSSCALFVAFAGLGCGWDLEEPPPKTRLKNPGFSRGGAPWPCDGKGDFRVDTFGNGAEGSCNDGTGGRSRNVLALTNSCA